jgi:hypothetical protein
MRFIDANNPGVIYVGTQAHVDGLAREGGQPHWVSDAFTGACPDSADPDEREPWHVRQAPDFWAEREALEMKALANWQPPPPVTITPPNLDNLLGGIEVQPWLYQSVREMLESIDPVAVIEGVGRLARLWTAENREQRARLIEDFIKTGRQAVRDRCVEWLKSLAEEQLGYVLRCGFNCIDHCHERLAALRFRDDTLEHFIAFFTQQRDDLESLLWALKTAVTEDAYLLEGSLKSLDDHVARHWSKLMLLPWPDSDLLAEVAVSEPWQWWGYIDPRYEQSLYEEWANRKDSNT